ncbi:hypothetical protein [Vacuolonema iberomarrocanum]|uniref:hypothetical protein n=1 Tax=Vacuolonema iberomarrocanum TaxID=3454632 RepID=UPI001A09E232|nr:hypothetical protein [filamentous cyanobacterium LEGE 07170]
MKFGIVVTTIYDGKFLDEYFTHFKTHNNLENVWFYVVGDYSTPAACRDRVEKYRVQGLPWIYLDPETQEKFLAPFPELAAEIPWNSDNRRNVGFLMAYRDRCDVIVAIDDDNYPCDDWGFLEGHRQVDSTITLPTAKGHGGWFNLCSMMQVTCKNQGMDGTVYARGFPYKRRDPRCNFIDPEPTTGKVAINAGLWSGDPDVDAATRLVTGCAAEPQFTRSALLAPNTLMPINTQNTALIRDAIPAYYYVKMGHPIGGMQLDRFGDIFSGFFVQKCAQAVGHSVRVGSPVVEHRRSPHNLYKDLWHELAGMVILDDMLELLESALPKSPDYSSAALVLANRLEEWANHKDGFLWDTALKRYFFDVSRNIKLWQDACNCFNREYSLS